jgi:hypothetical protein
MEATADIVIDALGGTTVVARLANPPIPQSTVHSWRTNGMPAWRVAQIKPAAKAAGLRAPWPKGQGAIPGRRPAVNDGQMKMRISGSAVAEMSSP